MLDDLHQAMCELPDLVSLEQRNEWRSLLIDYEKPHVKRLWRPYKDFRLNIHVISPCGPGEALYHPHPWPSATTILSGGYEMDIGFGPALDPPPVVGTLKMRAGSSYQMLHPNGWHAIRPHITTISVMLSGRPWNRNCFPIQKELQPLDEDERDDILTFMSHFLRMPLVGQG